MRLSWEKASRLTMLKRTVMGRQKGSQNVLRLEDLSEVVGVKILPMHPPEETDTESLRRRDVLIVELGGRRVGMTQEWLLGCDRLALR